jgi:chromosome partitioning protein
MSEFDVHYIIVDTGPGITFWSINSLAIADILLLTLKMGDRDIDNTKTVVEEIYRSFTKFGSKAFLLCNRVAGYCVPHTVIQNNDRLSSYSSTPAPLSSNNSQAIMQLQQEQEQTKLDITDRLSNELGIEIISFIPCYCDIQFLRKEFLTVLKYPQHPFTAQIEKLIGTI